MCQQQAIVSENLRIVKVTKSNWPSFNSAKNKEAKSQHLSYTTSHDKSKFSLMRLRNWWEDALDKGHEHPDQTNH